MLLVTTFAVAAGYFALRQVNRDRILTEVYDPAFAFYTKDNNASYGGIDRWAYYGMRMERVAELLKKDGYACVSPLPTPVDDKLDGIHALTCKKLARWPLRRTLTVNASIDYGMRGRLVAADAKSTITSQRFFVLKAFADYLRKFELIEPESLQVRGFEVDSVDKLSRLAADALSTSGWHATCGEDRSSPACQRTAGERRETGFPTLPQGAIAVRDADSLYSAMEQVRLLPLMPQDENTKVGDDLIVRVIDGQMWMDFVSRDLVGRALMVSIAIDGEGGTPIRLIAKVDEKSKEIPLAGRSRLNNAGKPMYLVPARGGENARASAWLDIPSENNPKALQRLAQALPNTDTAFVPRIIKATIARISRIVRPEEDLGLYPPLRLIEQRAEFLRSAQTPLWLPGDQSAQLIRKAYQDDPVTRAAWVLAACESTAKPPVIDGNCWLSQTASDLEVTELLRDEVSKLMPLYGGLEPEHPVRLRLERLNAVLGRD